MAKTITLEQELREANERIVALDGEAAEKFEAAEKVVEEFKAKGVNPAMDKDAFKQVDDAYKAADELRDQAAELRQQSHQLAIRLGKAHAPAERESVLGQTAVEAITSSPEYQRLAQVGAFHSAGSHIELPGVEVVGRDAAVARIKAGLPFMAANADAAALIDDDQRRFPPVPIPVRPVRVIDLLTVTTTDSDLVKFARQTTRTDAAAPTAKGLAYAEASYVWTEAEAAVKDIGHFTPAHRSEMADAGQLQGLIESDLESGVLRTLEDQVVNGTGTGQNMTGILATAGIGSVDRDATATEKKLEAIHRAITNIRLNGFTEPNAIGLDPSSYEDIVFEKDANQNYLLGPASQATSRTVWGYPVAISSVFPVDTALVGLYESAVLYMRSGVAIRASDSHSDFFVKRLVALLAELRAAFVTRQAKNFCKVLLA